MARLLNVYRAQRKRLCRCNQVEERSERWWFLNGEPLTERGRNVTLHLTDKGDYQLLVMDDVGQIATVKFVMQ